MVDDVFGEGECGVLEGGGGGDRGGERGVEGGLEDWE